MWEIFKIRNYLCWTYLNFLMSFFESYYNNVIKFDLVNKFVYCKLKKIPKIRKIIVDFGFKKSNIKELCTANLALELVTSKKGKFLISKKGNLFFKIKKGDPVGCQVILRKNLMYNFFIKLIFEIFYKFKVRLQKTQTGKNYYSTISYKLNHKLLFAELEDNYNLFNKNLRNLNLTIVSSKTNQKEFFYLINSFKQPFLI